jgi:hypothetical protein
VYCLVDLALDRVCITESVLMVYVATVSFVSILFDGRADKAVNQASAPPKKPEDSG